MVETPATNIRMPANMGEQTGQIVSSGERSSKDRSPNDRNKSQRRKSSKFKDKKLARSAVAMSQIVNNKAVVMQDDEILDH